MALIVEGADPGSTLTKQPNSKPTETAKARPGTKPPLPRNLNIPFEQRFDLDLVFAGLFRGKLVEVWHPKHGRGVLDTVRIYRWQMNPAGELDEGEHIPCCGKLPCRFRSQSGRRHWEYLPFDEIWTLAAHDGIPKHLRWVHEKHRAPRQNRLVQLFEVDRNRDMDADSEKWNANGGESADAETTAKQLLESTDITVRDSHITIARPTQKRHPDPAKRYAEKLAMLVEMAYTTQSRWKKYELENHNPTNKDGR